MTRLFSFPQNGSKNRPHPNRRICGYTIGFPFSFIYRIDHEYHTVVTNPTRQQRRAAERRAAKRPAVRTSLIPYLHKLHRKLPTATLAELVSFLKRFTKARRQLGFAFKRWKRETEGRLPDDQWPDRDALIQIALYYSAVVDQLAQRGTKLSHFDSPEISVKLPTDIVANQLLATSPVARECCERSCPAVV